MEKGISYSPDMVAAKLARRKGETRRLPNELQYINKEPGRYKCHGIDDDNLGTQDKPVVLFEDLRPEITPWISPIPVPYAVGDWLYTKEVWRTLSIYNDRKPVDVPDDAPIWYDADGPAPAEYGKYRHARFMPKKFARFWDEVTAVRCEQLQDITEEAAIAEGVESCIADLKRFGARARGMKLYRDYEREENSLTDARGTGFSEAILSFESLWISINDSESWMANPYVFVIQFKELSRTGYPKPEPAPHAVVNTEALAETVAESAADTGGIVPTEELQALLAKHPGQEPAVLAGYERGLGDLREVLATLDKPRRPGLPADQPDARCINDLRGPLVRLLNVAVAAQHLKHWLPFGVQDAYFTKDELRGLRFLVPHLDTFLSNVLATAVRLKLFPDRAGMTNYTEGMADLLSLMLGDLNTLADPREGQGALRMYVELNMVQEQPTEAWADQFGVDAEPVAEEELAHAA